MDGLFNEASIPPVVGECRWAPRFCPQHTFLVDRAIQIDAALGQIGGAVRQAHRRTGPGSIRLLFG